MIRQHNVKFRVFFLPWTVFINISEPLWFYKKMKVHIRSEFGTKTGAPKSYQTGNASGVFITVSVYI